VAYCMEHLDVDWPASKFIAAPQLASRAVAKKSGLMHGQLFLIKQLLILREQIAPFEADFSHVEKDLDFSHMRSHLRRILAGAPLPPPSGPPPPPLCPLSIADTLEARKDCMACECGGE
jgi:hypothetical protein